MNNCQKVIPYEMTISNEDEKSLIAELTDNNWASVIGRGDELDKPWYQYTYHFSKLDQSDDGVGETLATLFGYIGNGMQNNR